MSNPGNWTHKERVLKTLGHNFGGRILDYGCGAGNAVHSMVEAGHDAYGFDVIDYVDRPTNRIAIGSPQRLPFPDGHFDLILSDQVFEHAKDQDAVFAELYRITRPGGLHFHIIPAKWQIIEPHIKIPLGGLIGTMWWFRLWAALGIRHQFQRGTSIAEAAAFNAKYFREGLNYVSTRHYRKLWRSLGFQARFIERDYMASSDKAKVRSLARVPGLQALIRTFWVRIVVLSKPHHAVAV